jgi:diaminopimelate epimerase
MYRVEFTKAHCGGNDFVLVQESHVEIPLAELARKACKRRTGVGADGLMVIGKRSSSHSLQYLNQDGSEARFCGNGLLCAAKWVRETGSRQDPLRFRWKGEEYPVWTGEKTSKARIPQPIDAELDVVLDSGKTMDYVTVGVPHAVRFVTDLDRLDAEKEGRSIRSDRSLLPDGVNVDFCLVLGRDRMRLRTYERGVEAETPSCGSGAAAACFIAHRREMVDSEVLVLAPGGSIKVHLDDEGLLLEGSPEIVYQGILEIA